MISTQRFSNLSKRLNTITNNGDGIGSQTHVPGTYEVMFSKYLYRRKLTTQLNTLRRFVFFIDCNKAPHSRSYSKPYQNMHFEQDRQRKQEKKKPRR